MPKEKTRPDLLFGTGNREGLGLKGPVKEMMQRIYKAHQKPGFIYRGEPITYYLDECNVNYGFDQSGRIDSLEMFYSETHSLKKYFNEQGNETKTHNNRGDHAENYLENEYDAEGNMTVMRHYNAEREFTGETRFAYDKAGNKSEIRYYDKDLTPGLTMYLKYNEKGERVEDYRTNADGSVNYWTKTEYNEHGHSTCYTSLNPDGTVKEKKVNNYEYDAAGRLMKMNGRNIRHERELRIEELEHDKQGNWTVKAGFHRNIAAVLIVRSLLYYGDTDSDLETIKLTASADAIPYTMTKTGEKEPKEKKPVRQELTKEAVPQDLEVSPEEARWIAEGSAPDNYSAMRYFVVKNNELPTVVHFYGMDIEVMALMKELKSSLGAVVINMYVPEVSYWPEKKPSRYTLAFPGNGYLMQATAIQAKKDTDYWYSRFISHADNDDGYIRVSALNLFRPSDASGKRDPEFEETLQNCIELCVLEHEENKPEISMVEVHADGKFRLSTYPVNDTFMIRDLDMHYGYGFTKFHNDLMERFKSESRGLVLFHGIPGTGKTYYIRHLLRKMTSNNKVVIYMPPNMVEWLADPSFLTFMSKEIARFSKQGFFCVLLIEDAEPLLIARKENGRVQGISNLLNLTDGLLNDMLNLQIICTFNVKVKELDKALLRPGRLIARKEFRPMTVLDANRLAQQLGINIQFSKPATLAEVYSLDTNKKTLIHGDSEKDYGE